MSDELVPIGLAMHVYDRGTINDLCLKLLDGWKVEHCTPYNAPSGLLVIISKNATKDEREFWHRDKERRQIAYAKDGAEMTATASPLAELTPDSQSA